MYKEVAFKNHLISFGYNTNSFAFGIYITKHTFDIHLFPFFIGFELNGVLIDEHISKLISERISKLEEKE